MPFNAGSARALKMNLHYFALSCFSNLAKVYNCKRVSASAAN